MVDTFVASTLLPQSSGGLVSALQQSFAPTGLNTLSGGANQTADTGGVRRTNAFDIADNFSVARGVRGQIRLLSATSSEHSTAVGAARQAATTLETAAGFLRELRDLTVRVADAGLSDPERAGLAAQFSLTSTRLDRLLNEPSPDRRELLRIGAAGLEVPTRDSRPDFRIAASELSDAFDERFAGVTLGTVTEEFITRPPEDIQVDINANVPISISLNGDLDDLELSDDALSTISFNLTDLLAANDDGNGNLVLSADGILTFTVDEVPGLATDGDDDHHHNGNGNAFGFGNGNGHAYGRNRDGDGDDGGPVGATISIDLSGFLQGNLDELSPEDVRAQLQFAGDLSFSLSDLVNVEEDQGPGFGNGNGHAYGRRRDDDITVNETLTASLQLTIGGIPGEGEGQVERIVSFDPTDIEGLNDTFRNINSTIEIAEQQAAAFRADADKIASNFDFRSEVGSILEETLNEIVDFDLQTENARTIAQQLSQSLALEDVSIVNQDSQSVSSLLNANDQQQNNLFGQQDDGGFFGGQESNNLFNQDEEEDNLFPVFGVGF